MLDIRKPLGLLFILLGVILFAYGMFIQKEVMFYTPQTKFPLKLNMPVGLFMFAFGMVMWQLSRYVNIIRLERGLKEREKELEGRPSTEPEKAAEAPPTASADEAPKSTEAAPAAGEGEPAKPSEEASREEKGEPEAGKDSG